MSVHQAFRRQPVPQQVAQQAQAVTIPAPTRGIVESENLAFMRPGAATICDNWAPTMRGIKLRGGCVRWCDLHAVAGLPLWQNNKSYGSGGYKVRDGSDNTFWVLGFPHTSAATGTFAADRALHPTYWVQTLSGDVSAWQHAHQYASTGERARDVDDGSYWDSAVIHTSAVLGTFAAERAAHPTYWTLVTGARRAIISGFEYSDGTVHKMFVANKVAVFDVTVENTPVTVYTGLSSGNYAASQLANAGSNWLIAVNDFGDPPLRFDGSTWERLIVGYTPPAGKPTMISGPVGSAVVAGQNLVHIWKYRDRFFFIEKNSMNAWYLPLNSAGGLLAQIPLSGSAAKGGKLLFGAVWSVDSGDGLDDKCVFGTTEGELLIFSGSNPGDIANWRQEGRYQVAPPMDMNAHILVGGDLMLETTDGIVPISAAITKDTAQIELAAVTLNIKNMWRREVANRHTDGETPPKPLPWTMSKWDEYGAVMVAWPGGAVGSRRCAIVNIATGAWARFVGWDITCFVRRGPDLFFGTQDGIVMHADQGGLDDGQPYVATLVGGWGALGQRLATTTWEQSRASFMTAVNEPFIPLLSACVDYTVNLPAPPSAGINPGPPDVWDQGWWDKAQWDVGADMPKIVRNTGWVSIGTTGYTQAPTLQVTVAQSRVPQVELISIDAIYNTMGTNV